MAHDDAARAVVGRSRRTSPRHLPGLPAPRRAGDRAPRPRRSTPRTTATMSTFGFEPTSPGQVLETPGPLDRHDPSRAPARHGARRPGRRRHQAVVGRDARARPSAAAATSSSARSPAAAWAPSSRAATPTWAATWPSRSCSKTTSDKPELVRRFVEEAQIGGQLQHPGIVPVYELGTFADRRPYFTMKLVKGRTLAALLARARSTRATTCRGSWRSSSRSARRWPTPTPGA